MVRTRTSKRTVLGRVVPMAAFSASVGLVMTCRGKAIAELVPRRAVRDLLPSSGHVPGIDVAKGTRRASAVAAITASAVAIGRANRLRRHSCLAARASQLCCSCCFRRPSCQASQAVQDFGLVHRRDRHRLWIEAIGPRQHPWLWLGAHQLRDHIGVEQDHSPTLPWLKLPTSGLQLRIAFELGWGRQGGTLWCARRGCGS